MCLKYFADYPTCEHHEYLGSHCCSTATPCDLGEQHFHYVKDTFPIPCPTGLQTDGRVLACTVCAKKHRNELDPDLQPVHFYAPTNDFRIEEIWPTDYIIPKSVVRAAAEGVQVKEGHGPGSKSSSDQYHNDYKSLSAADDDEWDISEPEERTGAEVVNDEIAARMHRGYVQDQLHDLPSYLAWQRQAVPFVPAGYWQDVHAMGGWGYYSMPHMTHFVPPIALPPPHEHGGVPYLLPELAGANSHPEEYSPQLMAWGTPGDAATAEIQAVPAQSPATPPPTPPPQTGRPLAPRPLPPFVVGSITDAYFRIEAARRRYMRERARRTRPSLDTLPVRSMALTDFVVNRRNRKGHRRDISASGEEDVETRSSPSCTGEQSDTEAGAEEDAGTPEIMQSTRRFSCRLVTLM